MKKEISLPKGVVKAERINPANLVIISKAKAGKTQLCLSLPNSLLLDLENGSRFYDGVKLTIESLEDLRNVVRLIKEAGNPYDYIIVDTVTKLEEIAIKFGEELYCKTPMGSKWLTEGINKYGSFINLPNGAA